MKRIYQGAAHFHQEEKGQAMTEYAVVVMAMIVAFLAINASIRPPLNDYYDVCATLIGYPFP